MPKAFQLRFSPESLTCGLLAGWCILNFGCGDPSSNAIVDIETKARQFDIALPQAGIGPVKQFATRATQEGSPSRHVVSFEWPDGTEELKGQTYDRTKITIVESDSKPIVVFRYRRRDGKRLMAIEKARLDFGEYFLQPAELKAGEEWHSTDASETSDCRVLDGKDPTVGGGNYDQCLEIRCKQETTMPDGEVFRGETVTLTCEEIGVVKMESESSNGQVTIKITDTLESYSWNSALSSPRTREG